MFRCLLAITHIHTHAHTHTHAHSNTRLFPTRGGSLRRRAEGVFPPPVSAELPGRRGTQGRHLVAVLGKATGRGCCLITYPCLRMHALAFAVPVQYLTSHPQVRKAVKKGLAASVCVCVCVWLPIALPCSYPPPFRCFSFSEVCWFRKLAPSADASLSG